MLTTLTEAVCPSDLEDCALTYRESRVVLFARRKVRPATFHLFYKVQRAYCGPSIIMSGARSSASRVSPRKLDRHFHLLAASLVVLSSCRLVADRRLRRRYACCKSNPAILVMQSAPGLGDKECTRRDRRRARPVHLSPGIDACGPHCNISCKRAVGDGGGAR